LFYIFCCEKPESKLGVKTEEKSGNSLLYEPYFIVISNTQLKNKKEFKVGFRNGNYNFHIRPDQMERGKKWNKYIGNFKQIRDVLEKSSQVSLSS